MSRKLRRITSDSYDTNTRDGYQLVQEDWIKGSLVAIREYCEALAKEAHKEYKDTGYLMEKINKIAGEAECIEERVCYLIDPQHDFDSDNK